MPGKEGRDRCFQPGSADMPGQWPSEAENVAGEALPLIEAALHVYLWLFGFLKERGSHMEVADETDMMLPGNFSHVGEGHTLVKSDALRATACHLTDDSGTLPSGPEAGSFTCPVDRLPCRLQIGENILPEIGGLQDRGGCIIDGDDVAADDLSIDASR